LAEKINNLPVAELHCHLEATVTPAEARLLAKHNNVDISRAFDEDGGYAWRTFEEFLDVYDAVSEAIRTADDYYDITLDYFRRMAAKGVIYGEAFVSPSHAGRFGLSYSALADAVAEGMRKAEGEAGIVGRIIIVCIRHLGRDEALNVARALRKDPHPFVTGFGMAGDEAKGATADFKPAFDMARDAGLGLTTHAGEILGPSSVWEALELLGVARIGHGVRALGDENLVSAIKDRDVTLEICPTSNVAIGLFPSLKDHPFPDLTRSGLKTTLNSDDPAFFETDPVIEYERASAAFGLRRADLLTLTRNAVEAAFCDEETKSKLFAKISRA